MSVELLSLAPVLSRPDQDDWICFRNTENWVRGQNWSRVSYFASIRQKRCGQTTDVLRWGGRGVDGTLIKERRQTVLAGEEGRRR